LDRSYYILIAILVVAISLVVAVALFLLVPLQQAYVSPNSYFSQKPTVSITLFVGELANSHYGFGTEPNNLSSPGPTLKLYTVDTINLTVTNVGTKPHAFQIVNAPQVGAQVVFSAVIGSASNPLQPGESGSVVFNPNVAGNNFFYLCPISGYAKGFWGTVVVD
jgi:hypothetical protein